MATESSYNGATTNEGTTFLENLERILERELTYREVTEFAKVYGTGLGEIHFVLECKISDVPGDCFYVACKFWGIDLDTPLHGLI